MAGGRRLGVSITTRAGRATRGEQVTLRITGPTAAPVVFDPPAFVNDIATASGGTVNEASGTVTVPAGTRVVTVTLARPPTAERPQSLAAAGMRRSA